MPAHSPPRRSRSLLTRVSAPLAAARSGPPIWPAAPSPHFAVWFGSGSRSAAVATRPVPAFSVCFRPELEGRFALPQHEFGLDVIALVGMLRHAEHRSLPEIHAELVRRGVSIVPASVANLLDRYDELLALVGSDTERLRRITAEAGRVILAIDGLQPDVGHEVLWVLRDVPQRRGAAGPQPAVLHPGRPGQADLREVKEALEVPIVAVVSDGQHSIRNAVAEALPGVPHQLCHFHYLREAARPIYEADRHAKKELKKHVRGIRPIERQVEGRQDDPRPR